jgi:hypothetical protein
MTGQCHDCGHSLDRHDLPGDTDGMGSCRDCEAVARICDTRCPWDGIDRDECAMARERSVAGVSDDIPACRVHGIHPDMCECGHPGYDGHDMRSVPPECLTPGCPCGYPTDPAHRHSIGEDGPLATCWQATCRGRGRESVR